MITQAIGRYEVRSLLGEGTFGQVFAARDPALGRSVAIKVLRPQFSADSSFMERFRGEAASLAALAHPNVTLIYDLLESGSQHGMIMELVRGHTLEHVLQHRPQLELGEVLAIAAQSVSGLGYVHRMGVVHRDIKPSNIMLTAAGVLKIMDFGIARVQGTKRLTREGSIVGTLAYAAPEQIKRGEGEPRSDLYSLACVIYEMICGSLPFQATTEYDLMQAHIAELPAPPSTRVAGLPEVIDRAVMRALAKNPDDRFASAEEFGQALGIEAVQSKATEIVHNIVAQAGTIPPIPDRAPPSRPPASPPAAVSVSPRQEPVPEVAADPSSSAVQKSGGIRGTAGLRDAAPLLVMGTAVVAALSVLGFILLDSDPPSGGTVVAALAVPAQNTEPSQKIKPETPSKESPEGSSKTPPVPSPKPAETPAYQGRVVDWIGGGTILVPGESGKGVRYLQLYGVQDLMGGQQQANDIRRQLDAYLDANGRQITCFKREVGNPKNPPHQCYIGNHDIARWAVEHHLAKPTADAPQDYREASQ